MIKFKWKNPPTDKANSCWLNAFALATGLDLNHLTKKFSGLIEDDFGLAFGYVKTFLVGEGFDLYNINRDDDFTVYDAIQLYNSHDNHIIIRTSEEETNTDHVFYVHKNTIYDLLEIEERNRFLDVQVSGVFIKEV